MARPVPRQDDVADPLARAEAARDRLRALRHEEEELSRQRDAAVLELCELGLSYEVVARAAGMSRARVGQIVTAARDEAGTARSR